ncbi:SRPBCC family protein [Mycolicibacterium elephantis]|uniref:Activator of HSP90 ATPase n=1 Tax=Mycolicibacterium elephantis DSM 44368 TaxID=1335622 RepID=A0A439DXQ5_9MYCO|nr:SRPBCC family protein [Mycolicibacterium elephantis]MCV7222275.1 SRPBCC family protein [Mycolicibacterium elephantis]RWA22182.1 activator of HSP90 ATPase [Mycolicibacterium elephantis DSM 44368]
MIDVDVEYQINAVQRKFGTRTIETGQAHVATISQSYDTDAEDLWDAVTNIERIPRWLMPISGDLRLGGSYQLEGQAGGTILTCDPPKNFTATWEYGGGTSWIDVSVSSVGRGRARLVIEHIAHVDDDLARMYGPGAVGMGWDSMVLGLAIHLRTGKSVDPAAGQQWLGTDDGRRFLALSSERWCAANVAGGEDPVAAREMADRCLAAYLGEG